MTTEAAAALVGGMLGAAAVTPWQLLPPVSPALAQITLRRFEMRPYRTQRALGNPERLVIG